MYSAYSQARGQVFAAVYVGFRDSIFITFLGEGTSIYGGLAVFSVLGYMAKMRDTGVEDVVTSGLSCLVSSHTHLFLVFVSVCHDVRRDEICLFLPLSLLLSPFLSPCLPA